MNHEETVRKHLVSLRERSRSLKDRVEEKLREKTLPKDFFEVVSVKLSDGQSVEVARGFLVLGLGILEDMKPDLIKEAKHGKAYAEDVSR